MNCPRCKDGNIACDVCGLPADDAAKPLEWTSEPPTKKGGYWIRFPNGRQVLSYYTPGQIDNGAFMRAAAWAGPIPKPIEPKEGGGE